ncbi:SPOR domain-containing protein [Vibrio sp. 10N.261.51.F12]|uniref:SPOR domain-containing protein n=1 Tax=Vibrio sp. 10N.261.51.F12 TaxID=3229679 RepID=UPI00355292A1
MSSLNGVKGSHCLPISAIMGALLLGCSVISTPVVAAEFLCDASQPSMSQLPILGQSCPIGKGVWSSTVPQTSTSVYWIQCGILDEPMSLNSAKVLYGAISTHVWMKPEGQSQRCLIGPYHDAALVQKELVKIKALKGYKDAFIRQVERGASKGGALESEPKKYPKSSAKPKQKTNTIAQATAPVVKEKKPVSKAKSIQPLATSVSPSLTVRLEAKVEGQRYAVPYLTGNQQQFYMEHDKPWNRVNYHTAIKMCGDLNMHLVTDDEWQHLLGSKVMHNKQWPMQMPYWGDGQKGLFTNGKISPLKSNTLLNVVCVGGK